jgi:hypothetical protein
MVDSLASIFRDPTLAPSTSFMMLRCFGRTGPGNCGIDSALPMLDLLSPKFYRVSGKLKPASPTVHGIDRSSANHDQLLLVLR